MFVYTLICLIVRGGGIKWGGGGGGGGDKSYRILKILAKIHENFYP